MSELSVYISYRHNFSANLALALFHALRAAGFDAFIDLTNPDDRDALDLGQIAARSHFLVLAAPNTSSLPQPLEDAMQQEIDAAIRTRRNIVPVLANGFTMSSAFAAHEMNPLRHDYTLALTLETFDQALASLCERLRKVHIFGALVPTPPDQAAAVAERISQAASAPAPTAGQLTAEALFTRAFLRSRLDYNGKLADYNEALRLNPQYVYAYFFRAYVRQRIGDEAGAVEDFDSVIRLNPRYYKAYNNRAEILFERGSYQQALADYEQAIALDPHFTMAQAGKAITLHALGQVDQAISLWRPLMVQDERFDDAAWVGRELRLPMPMIDEAHRLLVNLLAPSNFTPRHDSDD